VTPATQPAPHPPPRQRKKRANEWRTPPAGLSAYAPHPHVAPNFDSLLTAHERLILDYFRNPTQNKQAKQLDTRVWVCGQHSYATLARALRLHWTTIRRAICGLRAKQSLDAREVWSLDRKGGRRVGTLYSIPSYEDALARRRALPDAAITAAGHVVCIGRARKIMTRAEAAAWQIDLARAPRSYNEREQPRPPAPAPPATTTPEEDAPAAPATGPPEEEATTMHKPQAVPAAIRKAMSRHIGLVPHGKAQAIIAEARKRGASRGLTVSDEDIILCVDAAADAAGKKGVRTIEFFRVALPERIDALLDQRGDRIREWADRGGTCPECDGRGFRHATVRGIVHQVRCDCTPLEKFKQLTAAEIPAAVRKATG
jgi:hypothetical protein